jgi:hypothetical protein
VALRGTTCSWLMNLPEGLSICSRDDLSRHFFSNFAGTNHSGSSVVARGVVQRLRGGVAKTAPNPDTADPDAPAKRISTGGMGPPVGSILPMCRSYCHTLATSTHLSDQSPTCRSYCHTLATSKSVALASGTW